MPNDIPYNKKDAKEAQKGALRGPVPLDEAIAGWKGLVGMGALPPEASQAIKLRQLQPTPRQGADPMYVNEQVDPSIELPPGVTLSEEGSMEDRIKRFNAGDGADPLDVLDKIDKKQRSDEEQARRRALEQIRGR